MSAPTATLVAGGLAILGTLLGVFLGLVGERFLRSFGRLWCEPSNWELKFMSGMNAYGETDEVGPEDANAALVEYSVGIDMFNGKEIPVGLRDVSVEFTHDSGKLVHKPWDATSRRREFSYSSPTYATLVIVNLPPGQWVRLDLLGNISGVEAMKGWRKAEFVGQRRRGGLFERKEYRETIATR
jgi:hypothetical protein